MLRYGCAVNYHDLYRLREARAHFKALWGDFFFDPGVKPQVAHRHGTIRIFPGAVGTPKVKVKVAESGLTPLKTLTASTMTE